MVVRVTSELLRSWPLPDPGESKGDRGAVLVVGGSRRSPGAVLLAGEAALRAGAGRVTLASGATSASAMAVLMPESGIVELDEDADGHVIGSSIGLARHDLESASAVLIGPGLDDIDEAATLVEETARGSNGSTALVWDAYALGALASRAGLGEGARDRTIITPNKEEASLLLGRDIDDLERDVVKVARRYGVVVSCYGVVADPDGARWTIDGGGPGLGTSGSGDVLAGITVGLAARGAGLAQAAVWATYLHARAGERAARALGPVSYLARELLPGIGGEFSTLC
jgi:hydroxyethylthiazole kinase-like uncharacterized protein yjeF